MKIQRATGLALGMIPMIGAAPALATEGLSYSYLQLDYLTRDIDVFDDDDDFVEDFDDGNGWALRGSIEVTDQLFLFGEYSQTESDVDFASDDIFPITAEEDVKQLLTGIGTHLEVADRTDFVGRVGYTDIDFGDFTIGGTAEDDFDLSDIGDDESDGFFVDAGVRSQLLDRLDGSIGVRYMDIEDVDNTSLIGSLMYEFSERWSVNATMDAGDEISTFALGVRWSPDYRRGVE